VAEGGQFGQIVLGGLFSGIYLRRPPIFTGLPARVIVWGFRQSVTVKPPRVKPLCEFGRSVRNAGGSDNATIEDCINNERGLVSESPIARSFGINSGCFEPSFSTFVASRFEQWSIWKSDRPAMRKNSTLTYISRSFRFLPVFCSVAVLAQFSSMDEVCGSSLRMTPTVRAVLQSRPSVVNIRGEKTVRRATFQAGEDAGKRVNGMGTGVVIDQRGYIITNHHVISDVRQIKVTMDGRRPSMIARLIARDSETDLAIIQIDAPQKLKVIEIGQSDDLMVGEPVTAMGNAYGYEHTVTRGIISALHRDVQVSDSQHYEDLIQTDASINPGNSGGPLLNIEGKMVGINVAVRAGAQGIGFAIPIDKVMRVASRMMASHNVKRVWHGLAVEDSNDEDGEIVVVTSVARGSPAEKVKLKVGDVIEAVGEENIGRPLDFHRAFVGQDIGDEVKLSVKREDEIVELSLELAKPLQKKGMVSRTEWNVLGLRLEPIDSRKFRKRFQTRYRGGLAITAVRPDGPAASQGIRRGDVLVGMHVWETISLENVSYILRQPDVEGINPLKFFILRGKDTLYGYLSISMVNENTL